MNKTLLSIVVLVGLFCLINCGRFNKNDDYKKVHQQRSKRRLQDVEKLMIEDEVLSYLICDMCGKKSCSMDYCQYCTRCNTLNGELTRE